MHPDFTSKLLHDLRKVTYLLWALIVLFCKTRELFRVRSSHKCVHSNCLNDETVPPTEFLGKSPVELVQLRENREL